MGKRTEEREHFDHYENFVRERISSLRLQKDISETELSEELGNSRTYINNITSGKCLPSMIEFFKICDYFNITPCDFFDESIDNPEVISNINDNAKLLPSLDLELLNSLSERLVKYNNLLNDKNSKNKI